MKRFSIILLCSVILAAISCGGAASAEVEKAPAVPDGIVLHASSETSLSFQWNAVSGAESYDWMLSLAGVSVKEGTSVNRNAVVTGLVAGTTYQFYVRANSGSLHSDFSTAFEAATDGGSVTPDPDPDPIVTTLKYEDFKMPENQEDDEVRAFPGAEGGGMYVTGGRGGKIIHVTNLNDSGDGSLRAAIKTKGARIIVFDVAGVIALQSKLQIDNGDVTIAGQTAPGDGICLKNYTFRINASNVIVRFIRSRMGDELKTEDDAMNLYTGSNDIKDVIIDHCSMSWSTDECGSFYGMTNFTLQWCILSESLRNSVHDKGKHGYGGIWGGSNATYHHNLLAHHDSRNPRFDHDYVSTLKGPVDYVNNVVYNWMSNSTYGGESANTTNTYKMYNMVNNYYKPGPATKEQGSSRARFLDPTTSCSNCTSGMSCSTIVPGHFYMSGNIMDGYDAKTADNWTATTASADLISTIKAASPFAYSEKASVMSVHDAENAFTKVLSYAGASLAKDSVDKRVTEETQKGTYTYTGSNGSTNGLIDTQNDVGGWPEYTATSEQLANAKDSDGDGMPDWFENAAGLKKGDATDGAAKTLDKKGRYTNLEMYFQYLVRDIMDAETEGAKYGKL